MKVAEGTIKLAPLHSQLDKDNVFNLKTLTLAIELVEVSFNPNYPSTVVDTIIQPNLNYLPKLIIKKITKLS